MNNSLSTGASRRRGDSTLARFGLSVALLTPFTSGGEIDTRLLGDLARSVLRAGAGSVTLFGTTGECASIARSDRGTGLDALLAAGCSPEEIVLGICATSAADAADQATIGIGRGVTRFLLLPPFYFKSAGESGLFSWHEEVLQRTDPSARFILYHIPQVSGVPLPVSLVRRLAEHAPERFIAIKDSSGNWDTAQALLSDQPLPVLVGDERLLHRAMALGGSGAISGVANLHPSRLRRIIDTAEEDSALSAEVNRIVSMPVIPALKALMAARTGQADWERLRPPLSPLSPEERALLLETASASHA